MRAQPAIALALVCAFALLLQGCETTQAPVIRHAASVTIGKPASPTSRRRNQLLRLGAENRCTCCRKGADQRSEVRHARRRPRGARKACPRRPPNLQRRPVPQLKQARKPTGGPKRISSSVAIRFTRSRSITASTTRELASWNQLERSQPDQGRASSCVCVRRRVGSRSHPRRGASRVGSATGPPIEIESRWRRVRAPVKTDAERHQGALLRAGARATHAPSDQAPSSPEPSPPAEHQNAEPRSEPRRRRTRCRTPAASSTARSGTT